MEMPLKFPSWQTDICQHHHAYIFSFTETELRVCLLWGLTSAGVLATYHTPVNSIERESTCAQTPLLEARGSTPMLAHMVWNWALKAGSFRMSSLHAQGPETHLLRMYPIFLGIVFKACCWMP